MGNAVYIFVQVISKKEFFWRVIIELAEKLDYFTYSDYCEWDTDERYELIDGVPYLMSSPTFRHQRILAQLATAFGNFLRKKSCVALMAPFDVRLNADEEDDTVVQPDLMVICDKTKLTDGKSCKGAPDLIVEILSASTLGYDRGIKLQKYIEAGVPECWIIDSENEIVQVYILQEDHSAIMRSYGVKDTIPVSILKGFKVRLEEVFAE